MLKGEIGEHESSTKKSPDYKMSTSVDEDIAYVDYIAEEAQRFSRMFEPGFEPSFRTPSPSPMEGEEFNDTYDDYGFDDDGFDDFDDDDYYDDNASASASAPSAALTKQEKKQNKQKKRRVLQADEATPKRSRTSTSASASASASAALSHEDMKTWKFAPHRPEATRFRKKTVVGPVFITAVDRSNGKIVVFGQRFLQFAGGSTYVAEAQRDAQGEYFHLFKHPVYGEGKTKIRPSTPPDCDADVDAERARVAEKKAREEAEEAQRNAEERRLSRERRERQKLAERRARAERVPETLHVGDFVKYENPIKREGPLLEAQIIAMRDPTGRVPWSRRTNWQFEGFFSSELEPKTHVIISRRKGQPPSAAEGVGGWLWPIDTYVLPSAYEPELIESEKQKLMREFVERGNQSMRRAEQEFMSGQRDAELSDDDSDEKPAGASGASASAPVDLYPNLRF